MALPRVPTPPGPGSRSAPHLPPAVADDSSPAPLPVAASGGAAGVPFSSVSFVGSFSFSCLRLCGVLLQRQACQCHGALRALLVSSAI